MAAHLAPALDALRNGEFVVVVDDASRENEGDLVLAAAAVTAEKMAFLLRHTSGIVCVPMPPERADALALPPMVAQNTDPHATAFTVSVDAVADTTTGISASDRSATVRRLADPTTQPDDLSRPGHVFPLRAHPAGVLGRQGHTEAAVELTRLAGAGDAAVICELVRDDGAVAGTDDIAEFATRYGLPLVRVADVVAARSGGAVEHVATVPLATSHGDFDVTLLRTWPDGLEHLVLSVGDLDGPQPVLTRVHSECATGDLFGSRRCDCGEQLNAALDAIVAAGRGVLVYERGHEGRGIGLADKLRAYALQDDGVDTVDANLLLGHPADARDFAPAAAVLRHLGVRGVRLLTNNPQKSTALRQAGLDVTTAALRAVPVTENIRYLRTKQQRMHHDLGLSKEPAALADVSSGQ